MKKLNQAVEKMTKENYGCSFMTGEKRKSHQTVDELKNISEQKKFAQREKDIITAEQNISEREKVLNDKIVFLEKKSIR